MTKKGKETKVEVNEGFCEIPEAVLCDFHHYGHLDEEKLQRGLQEEMQAMKDFDVFEEVAAADLTSKQLQTTIEARFEC